MPRGASASPRKPGAGATVKEDKSSWRKSWIREGTTITRTDATQKYRINLDHIRGLKFTTTTGRYGPMYLYDEREVERVAWERHKGPTKFLEMLQKKYIKWSRSERKPETPFKMPSMYAAMVLEGKSPMHNVSTPTRSPSRARTAPYTPTRSPTRSPSPVFIVSPEAEPDWKDDCETPTRVAAKVKAYFVRTGQEWIWDRIFQAYLDTDLEDFVVNGDKDRNAIDAFFEGAVDWLEDRYDFRPSDEPEEGEPEDEMLPSASFEELQNVLKRAPVHEPETHGDPERGIVFDEGCFGNERDTWDWVQSYYKSVYRALRGVIQEHGRDGWKRARWIVYDKFVDCNLGGIEHHQDEGWRDEGDFWFDPEEYKYMDAKEKRRFCKSLVVARVAE